MGSWALGYRGTVFAELEVICLLLVVSTHHTTVTVEHRINTSMLRLRRVCESFAHCAKRETRMMVAVYSSGAMATAPLATFGGGAPVEQLHASLASRAGQPARSLAEACED